MVDFDRLEVKVLEGFGAGAVVYSILQATAVIGGANYAYLGVVGTALFAGLTVLGAVVGIGEPKKVA